MSKTRGRNYGTNHLSRYTFNVISWENITINGNLSLGSGISKVNIRSGKEVIQDCESVIDCEIILDNATSGLTAFASPPLTDQTTVTHYCQGTQTGMNPYQANTNANTAGNSETNEKKGVFTNEKPSLAVYPNPVRESAEIAYTVPMEDQVSITLTDMMGKKVLDLQNIYQASGNYRIDLPAAELPQGIYFCILQTCRQTITRRVLVSR